MLRLRSPIIASSTLITALLALAVPATVALPATAATASAGPLMARAGAAISPMAGGSNDFFNGDSCTGRTFCMAVGGYTLNGHNPGLSQMLTGGLWVTESVPSPSQGVNIFANEVSCASPASCLFVGDHFAGQRGPTSNLAEAWNGSSWRIVTATGPAGAAFSGLDDVACPTTRFCLAVGFAGRARTFQDTAYTWKKGTTWRRITVPHPHRARNSELGGLACFNARNCMAVGNYTSTRGRFLPFAVRWHDGRWKLLTTPAVRGGQSTTFQGISCPAATRCVAVGDTLDSTRITRGARRKLLFSHAFAEVWNGSSWKVSMVRRQPSYFVSVSCPGRNHCFASGSTFPAELAHPLIEAWNGRTWTTQHPARTSAPRAGDTLQHVSCVTKARCEAVGFRFDPGVANSDQTLAEVYNGHHWTVQTTANP